MNPVVKTVCKAVSTTVLVLAVVLAVMLVGVRLVGFEVYTVLSGSMEPTYHTGSIVYVKKCEPEDIKVGDPITFVMNEDLVVATHRVIEIDAENEHFYTKGDANEAPDAAPVHFNNLIGTPVFTIPLMGYVANYVQNPPGCYIAIAVCALVLMLMFLPDLFSKDEEEEVEGKKKGKGKDGEEAGGLGGRIPNRPAYAAGVYQQMARGKHAKPGSPVDAPEVQPQAYAQPMPMYVPQGYAPVGQPMPQGYAAPAPGYAPQGYAHPDQPYAQPVYYQPVYVDQYGRPVMPVQASEVQPQAEFDWHTQQEPAQQAAYEVEVPPLYQPTQGMRPITPGQRGADDFWGRGSRGSGRRP